MCNSDYAWSHVKKGKNIKAKTANRSLLTVRKYVLFALEMVFIIPIKHEEKSRKMSKSMYESNHLVSYDIILAM